MPLVDFDRLPDDARVWVFGSDQPLDERQRARLLGAVDAYLAQWKAHGAPLTCARSWRDDRFLTVGVDQRSAGASGCSIDALFRVLQELEQALGASLVGGGRVFWRDRDGEVRSADRGDFMELAERGEIRRDTLVFDLTVTSLRDRRERFERPAAESWHGQLLPTGVRREA